MAGNVRVKPKDPQSTHQVSLSDGRTTWGIKLQDGARGVQESPVTPSNIRISGAGSKFGDFDPSMSHIEIRDWSGGRGLEAHVDDPTKYYDSKDCFTLIPGRLIPGIQPELSSGTRPQDANIPGKVAWRALLGDQRYQSVSVTAAAAMNMKSIQFLLRKVGNPSSAGLTVRHVLSSGGLPEGTINSSAGGTSSITDNAATWFSFSGTTTVASTAAQPYCLTIYGGANDNQANHWEVAIDSTASAGGWTSSNGASGGWNSTDGKPYYRVLSSAGGSRKWHLFHVSSSKLYAVDQPDASTATSQVWTLTSGTQTWSTVTCSAALTGQVVDVCPMGKMFLFARRSTAGGTTGLAYFKYNSSHDLTIGNINAERLHSFYDPVDGPQIWRAVTTSAHVSRAAHVAYGSSFSFTPSTGIPIGSSEHNILEITDYDDQIYVRKADSIWPVKNDRASRLGIGIDAVFETAEYMPMWAKDLFLFFGWSHSVQRLYGGTVNDMGPWKGAGVPSSRAGPPSCFEPGIGFLFVGFDAGSTGVSSVMALDVEIGSWHEIFRAPLAGMRIQNLKWDPHPGGRPRLWISCGGELWFLTFPRNVINPLRDSGMKYIHEGVLESATIDMGAAELPKLFSELSAITKNLNSSGSEVMVEYQLDDSIGSTSWTGIGKFVISPAESVRIMRGDKHRLRLRTFLRTSDNTVPVEVHAEVLKAAARTPIKRQWNLRAQAGTFQVTQLGLPDADPDDFYKWFHDVAGSARPLHMRSVWGAMDDIYVYAEAPTVVREYTTPAGEWGAVFHVALREL